ncbi:MAG: FtsQ-type POTRA domain-containing protein [Clostridia bacterium]|jgi:hypothetical protein|nr:FtsQ-type POTRA domain-containing protein [Clostridia bacterium]MDD4275966.1 FtsQ-type POTRA domain-containing protein [Clostridia bacterium]
MKNKRLIVILGILFFIAFIVVLSSTVFTLQSVSLSFGQTLNVETTVFGTEQERVAVIESGNFNYGNCIFFIDKNENIDNLEKLNPYIKIVNIETKFPNKLVIHALEREELYSVRLNENSYAITDSTLKVLDIATSVRGVDILIPSLSTVLTAEEGEILNISEECINTLTNVYEVLSNIGGTENNIGYSVVDIVATFQKFQLNSVEDTLIISTYQGTIITINNPQNDLFTKLWQAVSAFENAPSIYTTIIVEDIVDSLNPDFYVFYAE